MSLATGYERVRQYRATISGSMCRRTFLPALVPLPHPLHPFEAPRAPEARLAFKRCMVNVKNNNFYVVISAASMVVWLAAPLYIVAVIARIIGIIAVAVLALGTWVVYRLISSPVRERPERSLALKLVVPDTFESAKDDSPWGTLLELVRRHYILTWYSKISPSPAFPDAVEILIRQAVLNAIAKGQKVDWPHFLVSRIVPLLKTHLRDFARAQHSTVPKLHPALTSIEVHLRHVVERIVQGILPEADKTLVVATLVREIGLSVVLPVFDMLADNDFWNQQIDERGGRYLHERQVQ